MKIAIMQPYFLPYLGYFQLMNAVDIWVNMDHATFIKKGFMHKNSVADNQIIRVPLLGASQNLNTREIQVDYNSKLLHKLSITLEHRYAKAPYYQVGKSILAKCIESQPENLSAFNWQLIEQIHAYLGMTTTLVETSIGLTSQKKADGMIEIAKKFEANEIMNPIGGSQLYDKSYFREKGLEINFLNMVVKGEEDKWSIFHHLCHYSADQIQERLTEFELS